MSVAITSRTKYIVLLCLSSSLSQRPVSAPWSFMDDDNVGRLHTNFPCNRNWRLIDAHGFAAGASAAATAAADNN